MPFGLGKKKESSVTLVDELQKLVNNPKYYENLPGSENIQVIQKELYHALHCGIPSLDDVLDSRKTMNDFLSEAEKEKEKAKLLEKEAKIEPKFKEEKQREAKKQYDQAAIAYWKAATLGLLRKEIRAKIDPEATDVKLENVVEYFQMATDLGLKIPYQAIMKYPRIAREIESDRFAGYQPKAQEAKK